MKSIRKFPHLVGCIALLGAAALGLTSCGPAGAPQNAATQQNPPGSAFAPWRADLQLDAPSELTAWPWPGARKTAPHRGVTHWLAQAKDDTSVELLRFDFKVNPGLRFELYSQDEDDAKPFDNVVQFWRLGVGQATRKLNRKFGAARQGAVVAAWNGPFFGYYRSSPIPDETAFHLAPIVLRRQVHFNTGNHRWTFGVQSRNARPVFKTFHLPGRKLLEREFDFASGALQCLVKDGKPLKMEPFPTSRASFRPQPVPSAPQEAGHIPYFDHAKFSRASMAWSRDNSQLYLLLVREPNSDGEGPSITTLKFGQQPQARGWNVPDVQRFWLSMLRQKLIWNAVNSDAGGVAQLCYRLPDGRYSLTSPQGDNPKYVRRIFAPDFKDAPAGGSLMYFYVRDAGA